MKKNKLTQSLMSGRRLARSAIWNFAGMASPLIVGLVAMPLLIDGMGKERFGLLTIIWMGVGYFSLFDMGLGRALTKLVAERLGKGQTTDMGRLIWTAVLLIVGLGMFGTAVVLLGAEPLIRHVLNVDPKIQEETIKAFRILAIGLPVVVFTTAMIGLLEAHQRFASIAAVRIPLGILTFAGPLATTQFTPDLVWATTALLFARVTAAATLFFLAASVRKELKNPQLPSRKVIGPLFHFGGWLTVTNIISPMMVYFDRFIIGSMLSMTAVTFYVTPYEVVSRVQRIPQAMMGVIFPAMATAMAGERERLVYLYKQTIRILLLLMLPPMAAIFLLAHEGLELWLGPQFSASSTAVVQWLALGVLINSFARVPLTLLQSSGRPDIVAKTHLVELLPYGVLLWFMTSRFGIAGSAAAWSIRMLFDSLLLNQFASRMVPELRNAIKHTYVTMALLLGFSTLAFFITSLEGRGLLLAATLGHSLIRGWPIVNKLLALRQRTVSLV